jgi:hypothetical protein
MNTLEGLRLLSLPNDILAMVCVDKELSSNDLAAMRLTNHELHAVATTEFAQRYFQDPFVMMLRDNLETLVEICKHPVFGPQVRKIQLLNNFFHPGHLKGFVREMEKAYRTADTSRVLSGKGDLQRFADLVAEQYDLLQSGTGHQLLRRAFEAVGAQRGSVAICSQKSKHSYSPIGWTHIAKDFQDGLIYHVLGMPQVLSTINILLKAAQAGACTVSQLDVGIDCCHSYSYRGEVISARDMDESLLLGLRESRFQSGWQGWNEHSSRALQHLDLLFQKIPSDLRTLSLSSNLVLRTDTEPRMITRAMSEGLRHDLFTAIRSNALESLHLSKIALYQNNLLRLLEAHRGSLKKLVLDEVYLHGEWDHVLSRIADAFSLEYFKLSKARKIVENLRSRRLVSRYSKDCELRNKDRMREDLNMFIELQKLEKRAKEAEERRLPRLAEPRRSVHVVEKETSEDQKEEELVAQPDS